ncbi:MAG: hypothetical protein H0T50_05610, partial [Gemmatimonadales bacterium]|nr:hypothetical protein [Gemmatimonadales bacterium]
MPISTALGRSLWAATLLLGADAGVAAAQVQRDEQFYYPGGFNWQFLANYPAAARLFNAFDYGHAVLYERLYTERANAAPQLEKEYRYLTTDLLVRPPRFAVAEEVIMPSYSKLAWRGKMMFDWAHILHRQIYDAYSDQSLTATQRDALIERLTDYYLSNRKYAFTDKPKSMALMDEQYFSQTFRKAYPKFNGLIWAYHWLQVGLYEPFLEAQTETQRKAGVQATLARFWSMLEDPTSRMPKVMPMTSAVAPRFSAAHPRAAVIFDNLHMTHDIISDILTADTIPHDQKGTMIDDQLDKLQDPTAEVISLDEWRMMADHMGGIEAMGGPAAGLVRLVQAPATPLEAGQMHGAMPGMAADSGRMAHDMGQMNAPRKDMAHDSMPPTGGDTTRMPSGMDHGQVGTGQEAMKGRTEMMDLHARMMADPVIRKRVMADSAMRSLMTQMMDSVGAARPGAPDPGRTQKHEGHGQQKSEPSGRKQSPAKPPAPAPRPARPESADT